MKKTLNLFEWGLLFFVLTLGVGYFSYRFTTRQFRQDQHIPVDSVPRGLDYSAYQLFAHELVEGRSAYGKIAEAGPNPYPPFFSVFFAPLSVLPFQVSYIIWFWISVASLWATLLLSLKVAQTQHAVLKSFLWFWALSFTYPVNFVLERGTPELFILFLMVAGFFLLNSRRRKSGSLLFIFATHFKIYPLILGSLVWLKRGFRWALVFGCANIALLFVLGFTELRNFLSVLRGAVLAPERWLWSGNHSIKSFAYVLFKTSHPTWVKIIPTLVGVPLILVYLLSLARLILLERSSESPSPNQKLGAICLFGMACELMGLLPTFSHDYKLVIQCAPFLMFLHSFEITPSQTKVAHRWVMALLATSTGLIFTPAGQKTPYLLISFFCYAFVASTMSQSRAQKSIA